VTPSLFNHDPQSSGPQHLEDLAGGYRLSLLLFTAVEADLFSVLEPPGKGAKEVASALSFEPSATERLLDALCALGLLVRDGALYCNTAVSSDCLVPGKQRYQGDAILWKKELLGHWSSLEDCLKTGRRVRHASGEGAAVQSLRIGRYLRAMDCTAFLKAEEIVPFFEGLSLEGEMLDVGAGSGRIALAFLDRFPSLKAVLADIPEVLVHTREFAAGKNLGDRVEFRPVNILEPWPFAKGRFSLATLSNVLHAYSAKELPHMLAEAASCLKPDGVLVIHDSFFEHCPERAALCDLNMLVNTYNGRVFSSALIKEELTKLGLSSTDLIPLKGDTALIAASGEPRVLDSLRLDAKASLAARIKALGFRDVAPLPVDEICVPDWTRVKCRYGCPNYGSPGCPPHAPTPEETGRLLKDYSFAFLLEGDPPTRQFQLSVFEAERAAFLAGYYKAFAFWAGHCALCSECVTDGKCRDRRRSRPSMEGAGIDVFETVRRAGMDLSTLSAKGQFVKYYGLLLLE
jgi:predicted metal-binding protein